MISRNFVKLKGLNRRLIAVDVYQVNFLEEHEIDNRIVTNVHFTNGKWVTAGLSLDETAAMLTAPQKEEDAEYKKDLTRWREMATSRAKAQKEVNEALALIGPNLKHKSYHKEVLPDGSGRLVIEFEPRPEGEEAKVDD